MIPGEGGRVERLGKPAGLRVEHSAEIGELRFEFSVVSVTDLGDASRRLVIADCLARGQHFRHLRLEDRVALDIAARPALPRAAEPGHAMADVEEKRLALLLAVIADIDAVLDLLGDDLGDGVLAALDHLARIDRIAASAPDVEPGELRRAGQAAGMRGQDAFVAPAHRRSPSF